MRHTGANGASFFFNDTATTEIYALSLHDALPISQGPAGATGATGSQGLQGLQGPVGPTGATGLVWKGAWSDSTAYDGNDAVQNTSDSYISIQAGTNNAPVGSSGFWNLLAEKSATG